MKYLVRVSIDDGEMFATVTVGREALRMLLYWQEQMSGLKKNMPEVRDLRLWNNQIDVHLSEPDEEPPGLTKDEADTLGDWGFIRVSTTYEFEKLEATDAICLVVDDKCFYLTGWLKHRDYSFETQSIPWDWLHCVTHGVDANMEASCLTCLALG